MGAPLRNCFSEHGRTSKRGDAERRMADAALDFKEPLGRIEIDQKKARGNAAKGRFGGSKQIDLDIGAVNG